MILLMGFCAFYNGWIYNDFLSLSFNLFGSCYHLVGDQMELKDPSTHCTYPIGVDPVWSVSGNELTFVNSYKMKLSVIVAVIHMSFGIILKGINSVYFRNALDFVFEFVP
jgi:V-type H+-transporting ATPase subunit a